MQGRPLWKNLCLIETTIVIVKFGLLTRALIKDFLTVFELIQRQTGKHGVPINDKEDMIAI